MVQLIQQKIPWRATAMSICSLLLTQGCQTISPDAFSPEQSIQAWQETDWVSGALNLSTAKSALNLEDGISIKEAETLALFFNPTLKRVRLELGLSQTSLTHAKLWADPELGIDGEQVLSSVQHPFNFDGGVELTLPLSGLPRYEQGLAKAELDLATTNVLSAEWALRVQIRKVWLQCDIIQHKMNRLKSVNEELQQLIDLTPAFKAAGKINVVEERGFPLQQMAIEDQLQQLEMELKQQLQTLWGMVGLPPSTWSREGGALYTLSDLKEPLANIETLAYPEFQLKMNAYEVSERQLALEQRRRYPDLTISLGVGRDEGHSTLQFGLGSLVLPWWNANRENIELAQQQREIAKVDVDIWMKRFESQKVIMRDQVDHLLTRWQHIEERWLPLAKQQVTDAKRLAQLGELNLMLLAQAMADVRVVEEQRDQIVAELSLHHLEWNIFKGDN